MHCKSVDPRAWAWEPDMHQNQSQISPYEPFNKTIFIFPRSRNKRRWRDIIYFHYRCWSSSRGWDGVVAKPPSLLSKESKPLLLIYQKFSEFISAVACKRRTMEYTRPMRNLCQNWYSEPDPTLFSKGKSHHAYNNQSISSIAFAPAKSCCAKPIYLSLVFPVERPLLYLYLGPMSVLSDFLSTYLESGRSLVLK